MTCAFREKGALLIPGFSFSIYIPFPLVLFQLKQLFCSSYCLCFLTKNNDNNFLLLITINAMECKDTLALVSPFSSSPSPSNSSQNPLQSSPSFPSSSQSSPPSPPPIVLSPCAACKILRRRCVEKCVLAPYFPPTEPYKFTIAHRVFGASNIIKFLQVCTVLLILFSTV